MILVDTSIWVDHFRGKLLTLAPRLEAAEVLCHPAVIGELACGHLKRRRETLGLLARLPQTPEATHAETMAFVEAHDLFGRGLGWIDVQLLAAAKLVSVSLWTMDRRLADAATRLRLT